MPCVSVIIPVYNAEEYLEQCLNSVINQTLKNIEIICVDDGSTDNSLNILNNYKEKDNRIIILTQQNQYAGIARNNGLKIAKGKYLSFLDSDDFFDLHMLEDMYNKAEKDDSDIVVCGWKNYDNQRKIVIAKHKISSIIEKKSPFSPESIKDDIFTFCKPNPWTKLFKKEFFINNNLQFENFISCNDLTCICTALFLAKRISIMNKEYICYRANQKNNLTAKRNNHFDCFIYSVNKLQEILIKKEEYNKYKKSFINRVSSSVNFELSHCTPQQKQVYKDLIKNLLNKDIYNDLYRDNTQKQPKQIIKRKLKFF